MSRTSATKSKTPSVASLAAAIGEVHKDADVNADKNEPDKVTTKGEDNNAVDRTTSVCLEKGSPPCHPHVFKDGGLTAWGTTFGAWCMLFCTVGLTNSYGVYQDYYVRVHLSNYSPSTIGWIGSLQVFLGFAVGLIAGIFFDKGYFYQMTFGFSALFLFSNFMLSFAQPQQFYQIFLTQGVGVGISLGFLFLPSVSVISHHFEQKRALAMGIAASGSSCGGIVFPILINKMIEKYGFSWATRIAAFLCLGLMSISLACMRTRPPPLQPQVEGPEPPSVLTILKDVPYILAVLASLANVMSIFFLVFYLQLYAITKGVDRTLAFYSLTILNGASTLGRILPNFLADIVGVYNVFIVTTFACGVTTLATLAVDDNTGIICLAAFYGFPGGAYISLLGPLFASLSQNVNEVGLRIGLAFTIFSVGGLLGSPIQGALLTSSFHWERPIIFSAACFFVGMAGLSISRMLQVRRKGSWKV